MIPFKIVKNDLTLPKGESKSRFDIIVDGILIHGVIEVFSDTREFDHWYGDDEITYHIEFSSVEKKDGDLRANPISETGYRSHFLNLRVDLIYAYNFNQYLQRYVQAILDRELSRWEKSKQISLFN